MRASWPTAPPIFVESCNLAKKGKTSPQLRVIDPLMRRLDFVWRAFSLGFHFDLAIGVNQVRIGQLRRYSVERGNRAGDEIRGT